MKKNIFIIATVLITAFIIQSCSKPPVSTGHKTYRQSKKNR